MNQTRPKRPVEEAPLLGARILVIESRFHEEIADELVAGALARLESARVRIEPIAVPGALEIPIAAAIVLEAAANAGTPFAGLVALGCVIRGETPHFDIVARESARALMDLAMARRIALGNGILTVENEAQAWARARRTEGDRGGRAASAALALVRIARARAAG
ncbi:MAG: 6,7-dimethyl-8-ribityllumazine synthase [Xanthobacteraceae bacterium]|jgi:6,7-dimethyl-8-ribityllumazine synthase|nr:6,7-dimethyl-8-ribityllumazine synthase [Xanthobacteraceae bacterium]